MTWEFSAEVLAKGRRYLREGKVRQDRGRWEVQGSAEQPYHVFTDADPVTRRASWISCTCKYGLEQGAGLSTCSHAAAVVMAMVGDLSEEDDIEDEEVGRARAGDPATSKAAAKKAGLLASIAIFALQLRLDPDGRGVTSRDVKNFEKWVVRNYPPDTIWNVFGAEALERNERRWDVLGCGPKGRGWAAKLDEVNRRDNCGIYLVTREGWASQDRIFAAVRDPELFEELIENYQGETMPGPAGPTITDRIAVQITEAWKRFLSADEPERAAQFKGRVLGLAQAVAILRYAPNPPTAEQIQAVANEFKPDADG